MKPPVRFAVRLPDGQEFDVASIYLARNGTVKRIDTVAIDGNDPLRSGWYTIEGDELELVTLITFYPPEHGL